MTRTRKAIALVLAAPVALLPSLARANGFQVSEHGAAATSMVGAFTAKADDASAIFYNPAGLSMTRGLQAYVGATILVGAPNSSGALTTATGTTSLDTKGEVQV